MTFPRAMNIKEKQGLKIVKESGLAYEVGYDNSPWSGGYKVVVPALCGEYLLRQSELFQKDLKRFQDLQDAD